MEISEPCGTVHKYRNWVMVRESHRTIKLWNVKTWVIDWPVLYLDGAVGYDRPEIIPATVKKLVANLFNS